MTFEQVMAAEKIFKVMLSVQGEPNIFECSAIEHEGAVWLVPRWLPSDAPWLVGRPAYSLRVHGCPWTSCFLMVLCVDMGNPP